MLSVKQLRSRYGRIEALHGVDLEVSAGEIVVVGAKAAMDVFGDTLIV